MKQAKDCVKACLLFVAAISLLACQKEFSTEVNGTQVITDSDAVFTLVPVGSSCSDASVSGDFQVGSQLTAASSLSVTVNVTRTGNWKYTTPATNGISFSGAGKFTAAGQQTIALLASGKPVTAGSTTIPLKIAGANCSATVTVTAAGSGGSQSGVYYYKATIGGVNYAQTVTDTNGYEPGTGLGGNDDVVFGAGINYMNPPLPKGSTEIGASLGVMHHYLSASDAAVKAFFKPGSYPYAPAAQPTPDGASIGWTDPDGNEWDTQAGTGDQTGSSFTIISVTDNYDLVGTYYLKVKIQFNCKLYNINTGAMKQVVNGEMVVLFGKI
ncbi:MAG: hypothetical protein INR73_06550 [Williamsia sp.]|nr:hypothetical protein [Williamsia sp.]